MLIVLATVPRTQSVKCRIQDWLQVPRLAGDLGDRDNHVEDLVKGEIASNLTRILRRHEERVAGIQHAWSAGPKHRIVRIRVREQLSGDMALACEVHKESAKPRHERLPGGLPSDRLSGPANGIDLVQVERFKQRLEHLDGYLAADGIELSGDVLDRIDEVVPPGVTINVADNMWNFGTPSLSAAFRRR